MVACTTEMPLPIELVKAQLKVWEYKWVQTVGNPEPHWPYANKTTETYTYEYAMLTTSGSQHKMKLVLTHHVDAHSIPYLHVEVVAADKKSSYQKQDIMNIEQTYFYWVPPGAQDPSWSSRSCLSSSWSSGIRFGHDMNIIVLASHCNQRQVSKGRKKRDKHLRNKYCV